MPFDAIGNPEQDARDAKLAITAAVAGVIALVSWAQNALGVKTGAKLLPK